MNLAFFEGRDVLATAPGDAVSARGSQAILYGLIVAAVALGGSARADVLSLLLLRPLGVLALGYALWRCRLATLAPYRWPVAIAAAMALLLALQLVPLPPFLWQALPGRGIVAEIDATIGIGQIWRPLTLTPIATWNSLWAMTMPIAVLLIGAQAPPEARARLLPLWLVLGGLSGLIGYVQVIGPEWNSPLYLYEVTNRPSGVGLFANRNHEAALLACMLPMLAVMASLRRGSRARQTWLYVAIVSGIVLILLLLVTGSRAGMVLGILGLATVPALARGDTQPPATGVRLRIMTQARLFVLAGGAALLIAIFLALVFARAPALERWLDMAGGGADPRLSVWATIEHIVGLYFPVGSGSGSFPQLFAMHEPDGLLSPTYRNQAHSDALDLVLTGGLPGLALAAVAAIAYARAVRTAFGSGKSPVLRSAERRSRLGVVIVGMLLLASTVDYPLRTPSLACLFVTALLWIPLEPNLARRSTRGGAAKQESS